MYKFVVFVFTFVLLSYPFTVFAEEPINSSPHHRWVGLQADVGIPEGGAIGVVVSPYYYWAKITGSYTNNYFASGGRIGMTLDPIKFGIAPTLTTEYGFTGKFDPSHLMEDKYPTTSYQYINIHPGIEFGNPNRFRFFLRGGVTHLWANTYNFNEVINRKILSSSDPTAKFWIVPTFKVGFAWVIF